MDRMEAEKAGAESRLEKKDEELRYLQEELKRIRIERDELNFETKMSSNTDLNALKSTSLQLVDSLWNQKKSMDDEALQREMTALQERVNSLEKSNDKLKKELERATLTINDDDDEEIRKAKEIATVVSKQGLTHTKSARSAKDRVFTALQRSKSADRYPIQVPV